MKEFTKLSIHNHFGGKQADCTIDKPYGFVTDFDMGQAIADVDAARECEFELLGQTNSNHFDAAAYCLLRWYAARNSVTLVPGIEINLENWEKEGQVAHIIVLFDPKSNVFDLQCSIDDIYGANNRYSMTVKQLSELVSLRRCIICFHGIKQDERSMRANPEIAGEVISLNRYMPVAVEDNREFHKLKLQEDLKKWITEGQLEWIDNAACLSAADRTPFSKIKSPTVLWAGRSFDDLYYSVLVGDRRVMRQEDIVERVSYISRIEIEQGPDMGQCSIELSHGMNAVIGPSGSGKTLLLDLIKRKLTGLPLQEDVSSKASYDKLCDLDRFHLYDNSGNEITEESHYEVYEGTNLYQKVITTFTNDPLELIDFFGLNVDDSGLDEVTGAFEKGMNDYLESVRKERGLIGNISSKIALAASASKFVTVNKGGHVEAITYNVDSAIASDIASLDEQAKTLAADRTSAKESFKSLREIARRNELSEGVLARIDGLEKDLLSEIDARSAVNVKKQSKLAIRQMSQMIIFDAAQAFNEAVSQRYKQVNEKRQVASDQLLSLADDVLALGMTRVTRKVCTLSPESIRAAVHFETSGDSARLKILSIDTKLKNAEEVSEAFPGVVGNKPKVKKSMFSVSYDLADAESVESLLSVILDAGFKGSINVSLSAEKLIKYEVQLKGQDGRYLSLEEHSAGMLSKVYVSTLLDKAINNRGSNTIVLYDQPESNMEKAFLNETLADKFNELRQSHQLLVATHEPLLVVNADANEIVLASNDKKVGQANRISYANRSFVGANGRDEVIDEIAGLIDGGPGTVRRRSDIYEGMRSK